jgi:hypothetical protein
VTRSKEETREQELENLLTAVRTADPSVRIGNRDAVVAFGAAAIDPMVDWLANERLHRFAIVVLEKLAAKHQRALRALSAYAADGGEDSELAVAAVERLRMRTQRPTRPSPRTADVHVSDGRPPEAHGPCGITNRDGSACSNPGRWPVDDAWSCTTNYNALYLRLIVF